jgi:hypothetical protein
MMKKTAKKLVLAKETVMHLNNVGGGIQVPQESAQSVCLTCTTCWSLGCRTISGFCTTP